MVLRDKRGRFVNGQPSLRRGIRLSEDQKNYLSIINIGKRLSEKTKDRISKAEIGHQPYNTSPNSGSFKKGSIPSNRGIPVPEEQKRRQSDSLKEYYKNHPEAKEHHSKLMKGKTAGAKSHFWIDGRAKNREHNPSYYGDDWETAKERALEDMEHKCFFEELGDCKGKLHVHHIIPYSESHDNSQDNLIVLCARHHRKFELGWYGGRDA